MIETTVNALQTLIAGVCAGFSLRKSIRTGSKSWLLLTLFFSSFFFGDLYWQLYLLFYGQTPPYSFAPELNWYSAYLFLILFLANLQGESYLQTGNPTIRKEERKVAPLMMLIPLFTFGMCIFYMNWGSYINNLITAVLMTLILWYAFRGLGLSEGSGNTAGKYRNIYIITLLFCLVEYALWTSSCFWLGDTLRSPYFWFDLLLSFVLILFPAALSKEVRG